MHITIGSGSIEILRGDIAAQDTIAIVNAANNHLWMGAGVAGAIKRAGGEEIEEEAVAQGPVSVGEVVVTGGGKLLAHHVLHAAVMGQDLHTNADMIKNATNNTFAMAERNGYQSISIPAFGAGVGGFSIFHCAKIMISEAVDFLLIAKSLKLIRFVLYDEEGRKTFEDELHLQFSTKRHPK